jgi:hypothetical protein
MLWLIGINVLALVIGGAVFKHVLLIKKLMPLKIQMPKSKIMVEEKGIV